MKEAYVAALPQCDFCSKKALYDGKTIHGSWAYMCTRCFINKGMGLGVGKGQILKVKEGVKGGRNMKTVGQLLREHRKSKGVTLTYIAQRMGVSVGKLHYLEKVAPGVRSDELYALCEAYEIDPSVLFEKMQKEEKQ